MAYINGDFSAGIYDIAKNYTETDEEYHATESHIHLIDASFPGFWMEFRNELLPAQLDFTNGIVAKIYTRSAGNATKLCNDIMAMDKYLEEAFTVDVVGNEVVFTRKN